jgi:hypothetical protein
MYPTLIGDIWMFKRVAVLVAATAVASAALAAPAEATHSWNNYHWARTANPFTLKIGNDVNAANWGSYLSTATSDWNASSVMDLTSVAGSTTGSSCTPRAGRVEVCSAAYGSTGWLGLASISVTGGVHITQGTAKMNDTYFNTATYNNPNEKLHVMCQEVGHTFGLTHTSTDGSSQNTCMDYFSNTGANAGSTLSTHPNAHDYDELAAIYAHLDSSSTVGSAPAVAAATVGNDRSSWGREVQRTTNGRESVFVRDFGKGNLVITHVTWAIGH